MPNDLLKEIRCRTLERVRYDDDEEKSRVYRRGLDHDRGDAHVVMAMSSSELAHDTVSIGEQASSNESGRSEVERQRGDAIGKDVDGRWHSMKAMVDEKTAGYWHSRAAGRARGQSVWIPVPSVQRQTHRTRRSTRATVWRHQATTVAPPYHTPPDTATPGTRVSYLLE